MISNRGIFSSLKNEERETALNEATKQYFSKHMAGQDIVRGKAAKANLKLTYKKTIELASVVALTLLIVAAQVSRLFSLAPNAVKQTEVTIAVADIPVTEQTRRPPAPPKPSVPIPTESEEIPDDITIATTDIDLSDIPAPPPPPEEEEPIFIAYDEPPEIVGGMKELARQLKYPRLAQASGMEGVVFVKVLVGTNGKTERTEILQAKPAGMGFEESAINALQKVKWEPAKQRDRKIRVWVSIPVQFKLISS